MPENSLNLTPLEQMNQLLSDKQALIAKELEKLNATKQDLIDFQNELTQKVQEVKTAQEEIQREKEELAKEWEKLEEARKNLESSMEVVLAEKVKQEEQSLVELKKEFENVEKIEDANTIEGQFNLNALRESVGIPVVETVLKTVEQDVKPATRELEIEVPKVVPEMFSAIQSEVEKTFKMQKPFVLEKTPERLCMKLGVRELRVFDKSPYAELNHPELNLVVNHRNAKNDSKLQRLITTAARTNPDWIFETEDNQLVCRLLFKHDETPKVLVKKIKECIDIIEN